MSEKWYYARNKKRYGPFDQEQFRQLAESGCLGPLDMGWDGTRQPWRSANAVPFLVFPAQALDDPPQVAVAIEPTPRSNLAARWARLREIARWQRYALVAVLLLWVGVGPVGYLALAETNVESRQWPEAIGSLLAVAGSLLHCWIFYRLAKALRLNAPVCGVLGAIPILNFLVLIYLNTNATEWLTDSGLRVGLLGTSLPEQPPDWYRQALERGEEPCAPIEPSPLAAAWFWVGAAALLLLFVRCGGLPASGPVSLALMVGGSVWLLSGIYGLFAGRLPDYRGRIHEKPVLARVLSLLILPTSVAMLVAA